MLCDHCGYDQERARQTGSTHCTPPFKWQPHSFSGAHPTEPPVDPKTWREDYAPWHPITDPKQLKVLAKLGEELAECLAATCRCIMQGVDESHPITGKVNRTWLEDEIADVFLCVEEVARKYKLDEKRMTARMARKRPAFRRWHEGA